jgi:dephospho-CoA kinase
MTPNSSSSPIIIGLTGNIGVGKSTVLELLRKLGAHTVDADKVAHGVMQPGGLAYDGVVAAFGPEILLSNGSINRRHLANIVFAIPDKLAQLEAIVHPAVERAVQAEIEAADAPVVVIEAIKLLEGELKSICDEIWVVTAPEEVQIARLMDTRGMSERQARSRMRSQSSQEWKASKADVVIVNDSDLDTLEARVTEAWAEMLKRHQTGSPKPETERQNEN